MELQSFTNFRPSHPKPTQHFDEVVMTYTLSFRAELLLKSKREYMLEVHVENSSGSSENFFQTEVIEATKTLDFSESITVSSVETNSDAQLHIFLCKANVYGKKKLGEANVYFSSITTSPEEIIKATIETPTKEVKIGELSMLIQRGQNDIGTVLMLATCHKQPNLDLRLLSQPVLVIEKRVNSNMAGLLPEAWEIVGEFDFVFEGASPMSEEMRLNYSHLCNNNKAWKLKLSIFDKGSKNTEA